jgi:hypothetical protein
VSPVDATQPMGGAGAVHEIGKNESDEVKVVIAELAETLAPRFELVGRLGAGGMGLVVLARDPLLERNVAIKLLAPKLAHDAEHRSRFIREAQAAAAVSHPNIIAIHLVGELPKSRVPYFVMQHVGGRTLDAMFPKSAAVPEPDATRILGDVAFALAAAHERGIVHRDVKPSNIMVEETTGRVIVLDFGISSVTKIAPEETRVTTRGTYVGTPRYMSPEQAEGLLEVTAKSDSYSLGCVAFELMTRQPPFEGNSALVLMAAHMHEPAPDVYALRPDLSPRFARLVNRCLEKDPARRPSSDEIRRTLAPPAALLAWPPRVALPVRDGARRASVWLNVASALLIVRYGFLLLLPMPEALKNAMATGETASFMNLFIVAAGLVALGEFVVAGARTRVLMRLGFGAWPLLDILGDHDGRTGELLLGQRRFAALSVEEQRAIGSARVLRAAARHLILPSAALTVVLTEWAMRALGVASSLAWLVVLVVALAWAAVWVRAEELERRLTGETRAASSARQAALRDEVRLHSRWLDRYWGAWRGVDRERKPSAIAMAQRVLVAAILAGTLLACIVLSLRQLLAAA